jgi:hypothetical protein
MTIKNDEKEHIKLYYYVKVWIFFVHHYVIFNAICFIQKWENNKNITYSFRNMFLNSLHLLNSF